jgi:dihydropteroate synthase
MISQIINLTAKDIFNSYKKKYEFTFEHYPGLFGLELRNLSGPLLRELEIKKEAIEKTGYIFTVTASSSLILIGSFNKLMVAADEFPIKGIDKILEHIKSSLANYKNYNSISYKIGNKEFNFKNAYVMGILNVTPDSFSDGGKFIKKEDAVKYALSIIDAGADIIDVGGESTRPGSEAVSEDEELKRVIPIIEEILKKRPDSIISIDTTKVKVASESLKAGAEMVNDISGATFEPEILNVVKENDAALVIMHIKGKPKTMQEAPSYSDVNEEVYDFLYEQAEKAVDAGIKKIIIDPGIGFGKRAEDNFELIRRLDDLKSLSYPVMIGLSRKSFIGKTLNLETDERDDASNALNSYAISKGARIIRTHNVKQGFQTCKLLNQMTAD